MMLQIFILQHVSHTLVLGEQWFAYQVLPYHTQVLELLRRSNTKQFEVSSRSMMFE